mmetsp:Transcript_37543/g.90566  ORF Transcript_37543/g.90566 Transcript_37543/m.90566 type:complete len:219 (-) Transcript_37543:29-685(-)
MVGGRHRRRFEGDRRLLLWIMHCVILLGLLLLLDRQLHHHEEGIRGGDIDICEPVHSYSAVMITRYRSILHNNVGPLPLIVGPRVHFPLIFLLLLPPDFVHFGMGPGRGGRALDAPFEALETCRTLPRDPSTLDGSYLRVIVATFACAARLPLLPIRYGIIGLQICTVVSPPWIPMFGILPPSTHVRFDFWFYVERERQRLRERHVVRYPPSGIKDRQ